MTDGGAKSLERAMLALLVAADQCCPAIIGQAHLLYHAGSGAAPERIASGFEQLTREAVGLLRAITDVEEAIQACAGVARESPPGETSPRVTGLARLPAPRARFRPS